MAEQTQSLSLTLQSPATVVDAGGDWLRIVQADRILGTVPKTNYAFSMWLYENGYYDRISSNVVSSHVLYQQLHDQFYGPCGGGDGTIMLGLRIIKSRATLGYTITSSYGGLRSGGTQEEEASQSFDVDLTHEIRPDDYRIIKIVRGNWEGKVYNRQGALVSNPDNGRWYKDEGVVRFRYDYVGTYRLWFVHRYDSWTLTLPPRTNVADIYDIDSIYASTVRAFYSGTFTRHTIDVPDEAKDCPQYYTDADGNTYILPGGSQGWDVDGDGYPDGGGGVVTGVCACPHCGGTGLIPGCEIGSDPGDWDTGPSGPAQGGGDTTVIDLPPGGTTIPDGGSGEDCLCPECDGTGKIPGCVETGEADDETTTTTTGGSGDNPEGYGDCYELRIRRNRCTGEKIDETLVKVPCPEAPA